FLGVECPLAKLYGPRLAELEREFGPRGVAFVAVDANEHDSTDDLARFRRECGLTFPFLKDPGSRLAVRLGATRTADAYLHAQPSEDQQRDMHEATNNSPSKSPPPPDAPQPTIPRVSPRAGMS